jgi:hypothetical protein
MEANDSNDLRPASTTMRGWQTVRDKEVVMKRWMVICSACGVAVLFAAFLLLQSAPVFLIGTIKLTDMLTIVGGLLFIIPIYMDSVRRKDDAGAARRVVWGVIPPIGMIVVCFGILLPNSLTVFGVVEWADVLYLLGTIMMLPIFLYPILDPRAIEVEEQIDEEIAEEHAESTQPKSRAS